MQARLHLHHVNFEIPQLVHFVRISREQSNLRYPQCSENLCGKQIGAYILRMAKHHIRFERVQSGILEFVRSQFFIKTNPPALLPEVD
jgi:hypothetical protein